jgi:Domain of unknown function (DUF4262)
MNRDEVLADLLAIIVAHGWCVRHVAPRVGEEGKPFAYTIGLTALGHPEFLVTGLPQKAAHSFLNLLGEEVRSGRVFRAQTHAYDLTESEKPIAFVEVEDTSELTAVEQVYGVVDALQMVWCDSAGRLPWDNGFANTPDSQPLLGLWRRP